MDVKNGNYEVVQHSFNGGAHQKWKVVYESDGYYSLSPASSGNVLDLSNGWTSNGNPLWSYSKWSSTTTQSNAQRFAISQVGTVNGAYKYIEANKNSDMVALVSDAAAVSVLK